jgi:hypothetical protein
MTSFKVGDYAITNRCRTHYQYDKGSLVKVTRVHTGKKLLPVVTELVTTGESCAFDLWELELVTVLENPEYFI